MRTQLSPARDTITTLSTRILAMIRMMMLMYLMANLILSRRRPSNKESIAAILGHNFKSLR